jgi:hypothetical protein
MMLAICSVAWTVYSIFLAAASCTSASMSRMY